jgi:hypothetical protein
VIEATVYFGSTQASVESTHIGINHWVSLWPTNNPSDKLRIFCTCHDGAEALAEAFVKCGARRVSREVDAKNDF